MFDKITWLLIVFCSMPFLSGAQLCTGSLGDPIINITFGSGINPGAPLSAAATNYVFLASDCPRDGQYTVRNNTTACFGSTWHTLISDHTGNTNGYFMLVNASQQPSTFYLDTVKGLCANTTYEFAAWLTNVLKPTSCNGVSSLPNLTFRIERTDGTLLQTFNTGNLVTTPSPVWTQYGAFFTTPTGVSTVVLRMINNSVGGCGNDLALDDITFRPCGPTLVPAIDNASVTIKDLCFGDTSDVRLSCTVSAGFNNPFFQWQKSSDGIIWTDILGANNSFYIANLTGIPVSTLLFRLAVSESFNSTLAACKIVSTPLTVRINSLPVTSAANNGPVCNGSSLTLTGTGGSNYTWTGPNSFLSQNAVTVISNVQVNQAGTYLVEVINSLGCKKMDSTIVSVSPAPNAFVSFTDTAICKGSSIVLSAGGGNGYSWTPANSLSGANTNTPLATPINTTTYSVIVVSGLCTDTAFINVNVLAKPTANAGPDITMIEGQTISLPGSVSGSNYSVIWTPAAFLDNPQILQPKAKPPTNIIYKLTVRSGNGCGENSDSISITVLKKILIPNAFSPNGDGINDTWRIPALDAYKEHEVMIYDRYGQLIFQSQKFKSWSGIHYGKVVPVGSYYYIINVKDQPPLTGWIFLLR